MCRPKSQEANRKPWVVWTFSIVWERFWLPNIPFWSSLVSTPFCILKVPSSALRGYLHPPARVRFCHWPAIRLSRKQILHFLGSVNNSCGFSSELPALQAPPSMTSFYSSFKNPRGLPWWRSGWESACQCRGHGFEPWSGKIPHAAEQLGPWATTTEPARLELALRNKRGRDSERPAHRDEEWPPLAATRESPPAETKTHTAINK